MSGRTRTLRPGRACVRPKSCRRIMRSRGIVALLGLAVADAVAVAADTAAILGTATRAAVAASNIIAAKVGADVIKSKSNMRDLLTAVDVECERVIEACVAAEHPTHAFLGEEAADRLAECLVILVVRETARDLVQRHGKPLRKTAACLVAGGSGRVK